MNVIVHVHIDQNEFFLNKPHKWVSFLSLYADLHILAYKSLCTHVQCSLKSAWTMVTCESIIFHHLLYIHVSLFITWLALRVDKMKQIAHCDWLSKRARWSYLARSGQSTVSCKKNFPKGHTVNPLLHPCPIHPNWVNSSEALYDSTWFARRRSTLPEVKISEIM